MFYVLRWETTRYFLVGPFADELAPYYWAEQQGVSPADFEVVGLDDPAKPPLIIAPDRSEPEEMEPLHIVLRPTRRMVPTDHGLTARAWVGHTNKGTRITGFLLGLQPREKHPMEDEMPGPQGQEALDRELAIAMAVPPRTRN